MTQQDRLDADPAETEQLAAVTACIADYCEGYASGDAERTGRSLHPQLVKRRVEADGITNLDAPYMVKAAAKQHADGIGEPNVAWTIESMDIWHGMASAVVVTAQFLDYLHLGRFHDGWKIVNVLWTRV